jgi:hypothetical protein
MAQWQTPSAIAMRADISRYQALRLGWCAIEPHRPSVFLAELSGKFVRLSYRHPTIFFLR